MFYREGVFLNRNTITKFPLMRRDFCSCPCSRPNSPIANIKVQIGIGKQKPENLMSVKSSLLQLSTLSNCQSIRKHTESLLPVHLKPFFSRVHFYVIPISNHEAMLIISNHEDIHLCHVYIIVSIIVSTQKPLKDISFGRNYECNQRVTVTGG